MADSNKLQRKHKIPFLRKNYFRSFDSMGEKQLQNLDEAIISKKFCFCNLSTFCITHSIAKSSKRLLHVKKK